MATYSERVEYKEEILPNQTIQLRVSTVIERDGEEVGRQYWRTVYHPGDDVTEAPDEVQQIAGVLWTPSVVTAYRSSVEPPEDVVNEPITDEEESN